MTPYLIFGSIFIPAICLYVVLIWLAIKLTSCLQNKTSNGRENARYKGYPCIQPVIFIKHIYYRSHLCDMWRAIILAIKNWVSKSHVYNKSNKQEEKAGNKGSNKNLESYHHNENYKTKENSSQPKRNDTVKTGS